MKMRHVISGLKALFTALACVKVVFARCLHNYNYYYPAKTLLLFDCSFKITFCSAGLGVIILLLPVAGHCFVQSDLDKLLNTNTCMNCDLTEADLSGKNLSKAVLDGAKLSRANLTNTIMRMTDLEGADLSDANLTYTVFEAADLYRANFTGANLDGTVFDGAYLVAAVFDDDQSIIKMQDAKDSNAAMVTSGEELSTNTAQQTTHNFGEGTDREPAEKAVSGRQEQLQPGIALPPVAETIDQSINITALTQVSSGTVDPDRYMPDPSLNIAGFKPLPENTSIDTDSDKPMMPLNKEDLLDKIDDSQMCVGCDLSGMDLAKTSFKGIYFEGANFEGTNLESANLKAANLKKANLRNANLKKADLRKADLYKADLTGADLSGADLEGALISGADLSGADINGAVLPETP